MLIINQIMLCALATLAWIVAVRATTITEYSIQPSSELGYYHYPAPTGHQFDEVPQQLSYEFQSVQSVPQQVPTVSQQVPTVSQQVPTVSQQLVTAQQEAPRPSFAQSSGGFQPIITQPQRHYSTNPFIPVAYPAEYAYFHRRQQQQQQHEQQRHQQQQQQPQPHYQQLQTAVVTKPEVAVEQQFHAPALEQNAFTLALTHQGYKFGQTARATLLGEPRSSESSTTTALQSLNVKLPLPLGLTPLNNEPLPLQSGASFDALRGEVTSYGTKHPLKV